MIYNLRMESLLGEYHPVVNILSLKSNNAGGGGGAYCRPALRYRSSVKPRVKFRNMSGCFLNLHLEKCTLTREQRGSFPVKLMGGGDTLGYRRPTL